MQSKDITLKQFFVRKPRVMTLIIIGGFYLYSNLSCILLLYTNESNTPMNSKDNARKPFFVRRGRTDILARMMLYPPPPPFKMAGA